MYTQSEMEFKGFASLTNHDINILKNIHEDLDLRIERVNHNVGRVYVVDKGGNSQNLPLHPDGNPIIIVADRVGMNVVAYNNEYLYVYGESRSCSRQ